MKLLRFAAIWTCLGMCGVLAAGPAAKNTVTEVNAAAGAVTIADGRGGFKTYRTRPTTEILLNNQRAQLSDIKTGMTANITTGDPGMASRIVITSTTFKVGTNKMAPPQSRVRVKAT